MGGRDGCCGRTAWGSIFAFIISVGGLVVMCYFGREGIISTVELFTGTQIESDTALSDNIQSVEYALYTVFGVMVIVALIALIIGGAVTCVNAGKSGGFAGRCVGRLFIVIFEVILYILCLCWILITAVLVAPVLFSLMITLFCAVDPVDSIVEDCIDLAQFGLVKRIAEDRGTNNTKICFEDLQVFCNQTDTVLLNYILTMLGCLIIVLGLIHFLMCMSANFAHLGYRPPKPKRGKDYEMSDVGHNGPQSETTQTEG